jgi:hypothetical protein
MNKEVQIVEKIAKRLGVDIVGDVIDGVDISGNAVGTDGFTYIIVSKNKDVYKYVGLVDSIYKATWARIQSGEFKPESDYDRVLEKRLKDNNGAVAVELIMEDTLDEFFIVVYTDTLMSHVLNDLDKGEKNE